MCLVSFTGIFEIDGLIVVIYMIYRASVERTNMVNIELSRFIELYCSLVCIYPYILPSCCGFFNA